MTTHEPLAAIQQGRRQWKVCLAMISKAKLLGAGQEIYVMKADGSGQTNLTNHPAMTSRPPGLRMGSGCSLPQIAAVPTSSMC